MGKSQIKIFLLIRKVDNRVVGSLNIRWNFPKDMKFISGNIGYGIPPSERRKWYNKIDLYLGLVEAKEFSLNEVRLVCDSDNIASIKTIEKLGGILEKEEIDSYDNVLTRTYYFNIDETIKNKSINFVV